MTPLKPWMRIVLRFAGCFNLLAGASMICRKTSSRRLLGSAARAQCHAVSGWSRQRAKRALVIGRVNQIPAPRMAIETKRAARLVRRRRGMQQW